MNMTCTKEAMDNLQRIDRTRLMLDGIKSAGYNALCQILELEFTSDGQVWQFYDVPEQVWYQWRNTNEMSKFYHTQIVGQYRSKLVVVSEK